MGIWTSSVAVMAMAACVGSAALGGPLLPPVGPVTSSGVTLRQIEAGVEINGDNTPGNASAAFRITQPGRYYLSNDINIRTNVVGISIAASDVTIDMRGFGVRTQGAFPGGIVMESGAFTGVTVKDGYILAGIRGLDLRASGTQGQGMRVERVSISQSSGGIELPPQSLVSDCFVKDSSFGISVVGSCVVRGCRVENNTAFGIGLSDGSMAIDCTAEGTNAGGIIVTAGSRAKNCMVFGGSVGFVVSFGGVAEGCSANGNSIGFELDRGTAVQCEARGFATVGFEIEVSDVVVEDCRAVESTAFAAKGFAVTGTRHTLRRCVVRNLSGSFSEGFEVDGTNSLLEECVSLGATGSGFDIAGSNNVVMRCRAMTLPGFTIGAGNNVAPVVNFSAIGTNTNPHANFTR